MPSLTCPHLVLPEKDETGAAVEFADTTTTTNIASISMARPSKRAFQRKTQLKGARRSKKQQREDRALQTAIETPIRNAMKFLEHGKDSYWIGGEMVVHAIDIALPIFRVAFPSCQALLAFDNATNHCVYKSDALLASSMNLNPGGQQPHMRETFVPSLGRTQLVT